MNDEQFDKAIGKVWLISKSIAEPLRARDTAQREALVRVEAERDRWIANYNHLIEQHMPRTGEGCDEGWSRVVEARELQAQLADVLYILDQHRAWTGMGWEQLPVPVHAVEKIRRKLAQAEQHVCDKQGEDVCHDDACPYHGTQAEQQEAQGAQAVDERAAFEGWYRRTLSPGATFNKNPDGSYESGNCQGRWLTWQARAALATQPAVRGAEHDR